MKNICVKDIVEAVNGKLLCGNQDIMVNNCCTDSGKTGVQSLFVPIKGERVDGHRFMGTAIENGAIGTFTSSTDMAEELINEWNEKGVKPSPVILVEDTKAALQSCARYYEAGLNIPKIGVTGSVGKTTTKEMIATALSAGFRVFKTAGNSNSQIGVPITLMSIEPEDEIAVIEMGMSEPGEMERLATLLTLDAVVITNIGVSHIEQLGSQDNILNEKWHITDSLKDNGKIFLNGDDILLRRRAEEEHGKGNTGVFTYGMSEGCTYRAENVRIEESGVCFDAVYYGKRMNVKLSVLGNHNVTNALVAIALAKEFGMNEEFAAKALSEYHGVAMRQQITVKDGITYIDDSYNASPDSMKAGLSVLAQTKSDRKIAVLADMLELGENSPEYHRQVGEYAGQCGIDELVIYGTLAKNIGYGAEKYVEHINYFSELSEVTEYMKNSRNKGDAVLFKGSRGMKLNEVVNALIGG